MRLVATWLAASLWLVGLPVPMTQAGPPTGDSGSPPSASAAVLPVVVEGPLSDADRQTLTQALVEGLKRGDFVVVGPEAVVAASGKAADCAKPRCFQGIAKAAGATHLVRARVLIDDRDYDVQLELLDGATGVSMARTSEDCEICGIADAAGLMDSAAATLRTKLDALAKGPSTLVLTSSPSGAQVRIDGEIVGVTPLERPLIAGKRVVRVGKDGFISVEREVTFVQGVTEKISFTLEKVPSRLPSRPWGWVALSTGVLSIGAAVGFAALRDRDYRIAGKCRGGGEDANNNCERIWNTEWHVLGFALAGASLTTLGIAILVGSRRRGKPKKNPKDKAHARFGVGPGSVLLEGRF